MKKKLAVLFIGIILSCLLVVDVSFAKLYVKPAKQGIVRVKIFSLVPAVVTKNIDVGNFYVFPIDIVLEPTGNVSELIGIAEPSFTLEPNETKSIEYVLTISKPGIYTGNIQINVKSESATPTITYQSDLAVIANKGATIPELYIVITLVIIFFLAVVYFKNQRSKK